MDDYHFNNITNIYIYIYIYIYITFLYWGKLKFEIIQKLDIFYVLKIKL